MNNPFAPQLPNSSDIQSCFGSACIGSDAVLGFAIIGMLVAFYAIFRPLGKTERYSAS